MINKQDGQKKTKSRNDLVIFELIILSDYDLNCGVTFDY